MHNLKNKNHPSMLLASPINGISCLKSVNISWNNI